MSSLTDAADEIALAAAQIVLAENQAAEPSRREAVAAGLAAVVAPYLAQQALDEAAAQALRDQLAACQAEVAQLQVALADCQGPPPDTATLIGATCGSNDGGLNVTADVRRCYNSGGLPASVDSALREASSRARDGGVVWTSYKGARPSDAALRASLKAISDFLRIKGQTGWVTYEHEPDIKGGIPPSVYHAGYDQLEPIVAEFDNLRPRVCMTGFTGDKDPSIWETYYRPGHDVIGFDHYNKGHQTQGEPFSTPAENWGKLVAFAKSKGKKAAIGETGVWTDAVPGPVIKTRPDWYRAHRAYAIDPANGIVAAAAFDSGMGLLDGPCAHAWYGV